MLQQKSSVYSLRKWCYPWVDFCLFNIFFGKQSCRKLCTWWVLCSIRGESCIISVTGLIIYSPQSFRVFFYGPGCLISSSLFLILALRWGKEDLEWVLTLICHSHFFFPLPKEGPDLMSPVVFHLHFNCHKLAVQRGTVGGFKLPWSSTSPKYIFSLWKLISWPPWSVV